MNKNKWLIFLGLLLQGGICFAWVLNPNEAQNILDTINSVDHNAQSNWESTGPTKEDILASTRVNNLAAQGSREESIINAAKNGDHKSITTLIAMGGANLEAKDNKDRTALMRAAGQGHAEIVKILLDAGADVNTQDSFSLTALYIAVRKNNAEVVKLLVAQGAASSEKNFKDMFVSAVYRGNVELVKALAGDGAHVSCDAIRSAVNVVDFRRTEMCDLLEDLQSQCNSSEAK